MFVCRKPCPRLDDDYSVFFFDDIKINTETMDTLGLPCFLDNLPIDIMKRDGLRSTKIPCFYWERVDKRLAGCGESAQHTRSLIKVLTPKASLEPVKPKPVDSYVL